VDKINIVSSQAVLENVLLWTHARSVSSSPLVNSLVKHRLFKTAPDWHRWAAVSIHPHYGFVCGRHDAAWQPRSRNPEDWDLGVWRPQVGRNKVWRFLTQLFNCCTCAVRCAVMTSLWRHEAAASKSVRDITRISCFVTTIKLPHPLQIHSTVFVKKCKLVAFFKVVQQQTRPIFIMKSYTRYTIKRKWKKDKEKIKKWKVGNSIMLFWANNFCLQQ